MSRRRQQRAVVCRQLVEMVTDYLEGDLDPAARAAVEAHLTVCQHCTGYVQQVRRMLELTAELNKPSEVPPDLLNTLLARYRQRR